MAARRATKPSTPDQLVIRDLREKLNDALCRLDALQRGTVPKTKFREALAAVSDGARQAGYAAGAFDALCPVSPQHATATAIAAEHDDSGYVAHLVATLGEAHTAWCAKIRKTGVQ